METKVQKPFTLCRYDEFILAYNRFKKEYNAELVIDNINDEIIRVTVVLSQVKACNSYCLLEATHNLVKKHLTDNQRLIIRI